MTNLITELLSDIKQHYLQGDDTKKSKAMLQRVNKVIDVVNQQNEMSNIIIKNEVIEKIDRIEEISEESNCTSDKDELSDDRDNAENVDELEELVEQIGEDYVRSSVRKRHNSVFVPTTQGGGPKESQRWLAEYSRFGMLEVIDNLVHKAQASMAATSNLGSMTDENSGSMLNSLELAKAPSINTMQLRRTQYPDAFNMLESFDFDCFDFAKTVGRANALPYAVFSMVSNMKDIVPTSST